MFVDREYERLSRWVSPTYGHLPTPQLALFTNGIVPWHALFLIELAITAICTSSLCPPVQATDNPNLCWALNDTEDKYAVCTRVLGQ